MKSQDRNHTSVGQQPSAMKQELLEIYEVRRAEISFKYQDLVGCGSKFKVKVSK